MRNCTRILLGMWEVVLSAIGAAFDGVLPLCVADVLVCHDKAKLAHEDVRQPRNAVWEEVG